MMIVEPGEHPQPTSDAPMISAMLGKRTVKDLDPPLELPKAPLHIVANSPNEPDSLGPLQSEQSALIPGTAVHHRLPRPVAIDPGQLLKELHRAPQSTIPAHPQVEDATGLGVHGGPDPTEASAQLDPGLIDYNPFRQGAGPNRPVVRKGLNPVPYRHVGDADSPWGEQQGGSAQAQALRVGSQPESDGPSGGPFSLDHSVFSEELAQLVEGNRHRHHLPSSLPHLALLSGAENPIVGYIIIEPFLNSEDVSEIPCPPPVPAPIDTCTPLEHRIQDALDLAYNAFGARGAFSEYVNQGRFPMIFIVLKRADSDTLERLKQKIESGSIFGLRRFDILTIVIVLDGQVVYSWGYQKANAEQICLSLGICRKASNQSGGSTASSPPSNHGGLPFTITGVAVDSCFFAEQRRVALCAQQVEPPKTR